jgi:hypothetical protein
MMASKSPYFLQALGEAGQAGIATLQEQRGKEAEKADREADRKLKEAQAKYYLGEGRQTSAKTIVQNGILGQIKDGQFVPIIDSSTGEPMKQKIGRAEAIEILMKGNPNFDKLDVDEQNRQIQAVINLYNNTETIVNENLKVDDDGGFNVGAAVLDFLKIFE